MAPSVPPAAAQASWIASLRGLLRERLGHEVSDERARSEIASFVLARARSAGLEAPEAWIDLVTGPRGAEEWRRLVRAATVGETYFFRHPEQLRAITSFAVALSARLGRRLAVWCAGCATGEEAWSLAILLGEAGVPADILATDVNDEALDRARSAAGYGERSAGHMPPEQRARWLARGARGWSLPRAAELPVTFQVHNIARETPPRSRLPGGLFDLVVCRNVLLYFPPDLVREVIVRMLGALGPEGGMWLGPADQTPTTLLLAHGDRLAGERFLRAGAGRTSSERTPAARAPAHPSGSGPTAQAPSNPAPRAEADVGDLLARGFVATAEDELERRLARRPDDAEARVALAAIALSRHAFVHALEHLGLVRTERTRPSGYDYLRGLALLRAGRPGEAADAFVEALEADPDDWAASLQLALHYGRTGRRLQEEVMLEHASLRLEEEPVRAPDHGLGARLVDSVHSDPAAARRVVRERLLAASGTPARGGP
jgi:chemotaxis protein methyltransferase CheR